MIEVQADSAVTVVTLSNGPQNTLTLDLLVELADALDALHDSGALVLTGAGRMFSSGIDLPAMLAGGPTQAVAVVDALERVVLGLFDHPAPVVAAVNGHALAGGCLIALAADVRFMSTGTIGLTEVIVGVPYPAAAIEVVRHALGPRATDVVMSGARYPADAAERLGLISPVAPDETVLDAALARARMLAAIDPAVFAFTKQQLHRPAQQNIERYTTADTAAVHAAWQLPATIARIESFLAALRR